MLTFVPAYESLQRHIGLWDAVQRMTRRRALIALGISIWAAVSVAVTVESWPEDPSPRAKQQISCQINGKTVTDSVSTNPYDTLLQEVIDERRSPADQIASQQLFSDTLCALHSQTHLPLGIVYTQLSELQEALQSSDFNAGAFLEEALKREAAQELAMQREMDAWRQDEQLNSVVSGSMLFALPLAGLSITWFAVAWARRPGTAMATDRADTKRIVLTVVAGAGVAIAMELILALDRPLMINLGVLLPGLVIMIPILRAIWQRPTVQVAGYVAFAGTFICLWIAAAEDAEEPFTREQWRLLGWTLLATASAITWQRRASAPPTASEPVSAQTTKAPPLHGDDSTRVSGELGKSKPGMGRSVPLAETHVNSAGPRLAGMWSKHLGWILVGVVGFVAVTTAAVYGEVWAQVILVLLGSGLVTWGIGLAPPLLIRFVLIRRPIDKRWALVLVALFWMFNLVVFILLGSESKTHFALLLIGYASYSILRKGARKQVLPIVQSLGPSRPSILQVPLGEVPKPCLVCGGTGRTKHDRQRAGLLGRLRGAEQLLEHCPICAGSGVESHVEADSH